MNESKIQSYIKNKLRTVQIWSDEHKAARKAAEVSNGFYRCAVCAGTFSRKETAVDHRIPVVDPTIGFVDWNTYMVRLFCPADNLQVLCKVHHAAKTLAENELRAVHGTGRFSAASRAKLSRALRGNQCSVGPKSTDCKAAMSRARKGIPQTAARAAALISTQAAGRVPVVAISPQGDRTEFASIAEAAAALNIEPGNICRVVDGSRLTAGGYRFVGTRQKQVTKSLDVDTKRGNQ